VIYILGGAGFVGSAFTRYCVTHDILHCVITRQNHDAYRGTACDILIDASGSSRKYLAEREPIADFDRSVRQAAISLEAFDAAAYVLISSGDVYDDPSIPALTQESRTLDTARMTRYGLHKFLVEQLVIARHPNWLIIRAGGFVGRGLIKNAIFDMLSGGRLWLSPHSALQYLNTDRAAAIVMALMTAGIRNEIVNLGGCGVVNIGALHAELRSSAVFDRAAPTVTYELSLEKLARLSPVALPDSLDMVRAFAAAWPQSAKT
jgi:nucleoside-diphosphate-sugar epimerase